MSFPQEIPQPQGMSGSPMIPNSPKLHGFLVPSPVPTRRTRTISMSEQAAEGPTYTGSVKTFCRQKGHGFIHPDDGEKADIFVHISDIEGEWVPVEGDHVTYKTILIPPAKKAIQAVHVQINQLKPGVLHERWDAK